MVLCGDHNDGERVHPLVSLACNCGHNESVVANVATQGGAEGTEIFHDDTMGAKEAFVSNSRSVILYKKT